MKAGEPIDAQTLRHVRNLVTRRDQHLKRLYRNIERLNTELNKLRKAQEGKPSPGVAPETFAEDDDGAQDDLETRLERREAEIRRLRYRVMELENSTSWKITAPLRKLRRMLSRR